MASRLRDDGHVVRALARDPRRARGSLGAGFEYVCGHVADPAGLEKAREGGGAVHVSAKCGAGRGEPERVEHQGTARVAEAAARAGVTRIPYLSGCYVSPEHAADSEAEAAKLGAERALEQSAVPYTIFKPTYFMETLALHIQGPVGVVIGRQPHALRVVTADDYAALVSRALEAALGAPGRRRR